MNIDLLSISGHKIYGPKGVGALYIRRKPRVRLEPIFNGGGQERGMRSGTENVAAIVGFGKAAELIEVCPSEMRDKMENIIKEICPDTTFYGQDTLRIPNTSMILMPGIDAQKQLIQFDLSDISVSAGSACSSGKMKTSHVLTAMGVSLDEAKCVIRVSLGAETTENQIDRFVSSWKRIWKGRGK